MPGDNTARQLYLLVNPNEPARAPAPISERRPSGLGLLGAFAVALIMWAGLIWLGASLIGAIIH